MPQSSVSSIDGWKRRGQIVRSGYLRLPLSVPPGWAFWCLPWWRKEYARRLPSTTEGAETRLRGARKDDGEEMNFVPFISTPPADLGLSIEGGRVVARLCGVDTFVGRFPCRLDGRFRAFGGEVQNTRRRGLWYTPRMRNIIFPMSGMLSIQMHRAWSF